MRVNAIIFDVYGTLFDVSAVATALRAVSEHGDELSRLWRAKQLEYSFVRTLLGNYVDFDHITEQSLNYVLELHSIAADEAQRTSLLGAWRRLPLFSDVRPVLERFHGAGIPLIILSNGAQQALAELLDQAGVAHLFSAVLSSEDVGVYKPHPAIYAHAASQVAAPTGDTLFVSANGFDIAGARRFGFTVARIDRTGAPLDRLGAEPHLTVADFGELAVRVFEGS